MEFDFVYTKFGLKYTRGKDTGAQNVLLARVEIVPFHFCDFVKEIFGTVYQLVLIGPVKALLDTGVSPEPLCGLIEVGVEVELRPPVLVQQPGARAVQGGVGRRHRRVDVGHGRQDGDDGITNISPNLVHLEL